MLKQVSDKTGLTFTEIKVFLFLILLISTGLIYRSYNSDDVIIPGEFDYSSEDSIFRAAGEKINPHNISGIGEKKFDYKQEVLDFKSRNFNQNKTVKTSAEKSINLNTAGIDELITIPGLGEKTAEKILQYRSENGLFRNLEQLQEIKGIGTKKFNVIKNYVFIE
jgi:competence ComEA-like helix-hairpin-helix protein